MIVTQKHLSRRTVLRGIGATVALPLLDGMVPAFAAMRNTAANPVRRFGAVFIPMGAAMESWIPKQEGPLKLTSILQPLEPFLDRVLVASNLDNTAALALADEGAGQHSRSQVAWLTGAHAKKTDGPDFEAGASMDQIVAEQFGRHTQLPSLELALEPSDVVGACDYGYACVYTSTISWKSRTSPMPMEVEPGAVFERLFGDSGSTDPRVRLARIRQSRSILDGLAQSIADLERGLGPSDRTRLREYLESVRDVEVRIHKVEEQGVRELPDVAQPVGIPLVYEDYAKLMFDLWLLAFQGDITRVGTFLLGRELSNRTFPEIGVPDAHHPLTHHNDTTEKLLKLGKVNTYHMRLFSYFLERLRATPDGDGSLLDHSLFLYGSGMGESSNHLHYDVPTLVVGAGIKGGRHVRFPKGTRLANLQLTLLEKLGFHQERFGDSDGRLSDI